MTNRTICDVSHPHQRGKIGVLEYQSSQPIQLSRLFLLPVTFHDDCKDYLLDQKNLKIVERKDEL